MLHSIKLNDQDYEQLLGEALARIPLYTNEWTNFNVSDPGVTIPVSYTHLDVYKRQCMHRSSSRCASAM